MTHEELLELAQQTLECDQPHYASELAQGYLALSAKLDAYIAETARLRVWQANVTVALRKEGGCFFEDVPHEIRKLRAKLDEQENALDIANTAAAEWRTKLAEVLASRGEIVKACPKCKCIAPEWNHEGTRYRCVDCGTSFDAPALFQRIEGPKPEIVCQCEVYETCDKCRTSSIPRRKINAWTVSTSHCDDDTGSLVTSCPPK